MSKIANAPLIEVIFELHWNFDHANVMQDFQLLPGTLFASLKDQYPIQECLQRDPSAPISLFLDKPIYRFRNQKNGNRLFQIGPGVLTVNFVGPEYDWLDFKEQIHLVSNKFKNLLNFQDSEEFKIQLTYIDFFDFNFKDNHITDYLREKMHIDLQSALIHPQTLSLKTTEALQEGDFTLSIDTGYLNKTQSGIIVSSKISTAISFNEFNDNFHEKLDRFHSKLHSFFVALTEDKLEKNFK